MIKKAIIIALLSISGSVLAQPKATVQMIVGYSMPLGELKGVWGDTRQTFGANSDSNTYYMKSGINYGLQIKFPFKKKSNLLFTGGIVFNAFSNSKELSDTSGSVQVDAKMSILGINIGGEYLFASKKSRINPFIGAEFSVNIYSGIYVEEYSTITYTLKLKSAARIGFQAGGGVDIIFHNNVGAVLGVKYSIANLVGKSYTENFSKTYYLNDAEYTYNGSTYPKKNITFLQFYGGVSFYFGR